MQSALNTGISQGVSHIDFFGERKEVPDALLVPDFNSTLSDQNVRSYIEGINAKDLQLYLNLLQEYKNRINLMTGYTTRLFVKSHNI